MGTPEHDKIWVPEIRFVHTFQRIKIVEFSGGVCFQIRLKLAETSPENSVQTLTNGHYRQKPALLLVQISCSRSASGVLATDLTRGSVPGVLPSPRRPLSNSLDLEPSSQFSIRSDVYEITNSRNRNVG